MKEAILKVRNAMYSGKDGMELVQVAILIAIAVTLGLIFKTQLTNFVNSVFKGLNAGNF